MHHIDTSLEKSSSVTTVDSEPPFLNQSLLDSIVVEKITEQHNTVSGCFGCCKLLGEIFPVDQRKIVEVVCNGLINCSFCEISNDDHIEIFPNDFAIIQCDESQEIVQVKLVGEMVKIKRQYLKLFGEPLPKIARKATFEDLEKLRKNISDEDKAAPFFKNSIAKFNLNMKLISVHYQFDRKKLFFFYTADYRIDFRELAKELASEFRTRIELRQIGVRDEAKKIGGLGTCGREYCCISFLPSFKRITTQLANEQNLLSSMGKLSGPCGKLKCCLSFEIE